MATTTIFDPQHSDFEDTLEVVKSCARGEESQQLEEIWRTLIEVPLGSLGNPTFSLADYEESIGHNAVPAKNRHTISVTIEFRGRGKPLQFDEEA